jgi:hypothetical protein
MEDFTALAETLSGSVGDARGALILSRDGLVLGAHPADAESSLKPAWLRFAALGEPERGFLQFGTEIWSYLRRGAYAAFVVTGTSVRPGLVIDQIEMVLLAAEEARASREGLRTEPAAPAPAAAPSGKPRTPLHPEPRSLEQPVVIHADVAAQGVEQVALGAPAGAEAAPGTAPAGPTGEGGDASAVPPAAAGEPSVPAPAGSPAASNVWGVEGEGEDEDVDRFSLAREFSQLLQEDSDGADG